MFPEPTELLLIGWSIELNLDTKIQINYIDTKNQLADILTKGNFTRDEWNHLLNLFNISHFSSTACTAVVAKRAQQGSGEERVTAKSRQRNGHQRKHVGAVRQPPHASRGQCSSPVQPVQWQKVRHVPTALRRLWRGNVGRSPKIGNCSECPRGGQPPRQASGRCIESCKSEVEHSDQRSNRVNRAISRESSKEVGPADEEVSKAVAKKSECTAEVEAGERRLERLRAIVVAPMQQEIPEISELQSRIDDLIRERDALKVVSAQPSATAPVSGAEEINQLRATVEELQRERAMLRSEVVRHRSGDQSVLLSTFIDQGESVARNGSGNRFNPLA